MTQHRGIWRRWDAHGIRRTAIAAAVIITACAIPSRLSAQEMRQCLLEFQGGGTTRTNAIKLPSERYNVFQGGGVTYTCQGQGNSLRADSAEYYGDQAMLLMLGNVRYSETRARVESDRMIYYQAEDRLHAEGNVNVRLQTGTTMRGPVVDYYRVTPTRPQERTVATGRPTMSIVQRTGTSADPAPVSVVANSITAEGEQLVYASGRVEVTRPDFIARGDSAFMDGAREFARLMREPVVQSRTGRPFTLKGGVIDLFSQNRKLQRVLAAPQGHALSQDLELIADSVDLRLADDQLQRVMAWGRNRARALSPEREIQADSIDARLPNQRLRELRAHGKAYANSAPDSARIVSSERDWMRGNSIIAEFDSVAARDTTSRPQARRIVAEGDASSYYQIAGGGSRRTAPNVNYVRGRLITVLFQEKAVSTVQVQDQASGVYLEPVSAVPAGANTQTPVPLIPPRRPGSTAPTPRRDAPTATPATPQTRPPAR